MTRTTISGSPPSTPSPPDSSAYPFPLAVPAAIDVLALIAEPGLVGTELPDSLLAGDPVEPRETTPVEFASTLPTEPILDLSQTSSKST